MAVSGARDFFTGRQRCEEMQRWDEQGWQKGVSCDSSWYGVSTCWRGCPSSPRHPPDTNAWSHSKWVLFRFKAHVQHFCPLSKPHSKASSLYHPKAPLLISKELATIHSYTSQSSQTFPPPVTLLPQLSCRRQQSCGLCGGQMSKYSPRYLGSHKTQGEQERPGTMEKLVSER